MEKLPIFFKNQFESEEQANAAIRLSCPHVVKAGMIIAGVISVFELLLLSRVCFFGLGSETRNIQYVSCYVFLLVMSVSLVLHLNKWSKDFEKTYLKIQRIQIVYSVSIIIWGVIVTLLDSKYHGYIDVIVYMSVLIALPMITFENPVILVGLQLIGDVVIFIYIFKNGEMGNAINFFVYSATSIIASLSFQKVKKRLYIKQYELELRTIMDPLTNIYNRQMLREHGMKVWNNAIDKNTPITVIMGDVDFFKHINDKYGHIVGDMCLQKIGRAFKDVCEKEEYTCYRYGGEEFVILLDGVSAIDAVLVAEKLMDNIEKINIDKCEDIKLSISLGVYTSIPNENDSLERYLSKADNLMYQSKINGKNQYTVAM